MASKPKSFRPQGRPTPEVVARQYDRDRDQQAYRKWYKTYRWQKARAAFLERPENQFCVRCKAAGLLNPGTFTREGLLQTSPRRRHLVVDHIQRHHGDETLFWDEANWQPLCPDHHDSEKQAEERRSSRPTPRR